MKRQVQNQAVIIIVLIVGSALLIFSMGGMGNVMYIVQSMLGLGSTPPPPSAISGLNLDVGSAPEENMRCTIGLTSMASGAGPFVGESVEIVVKHLGSGEVWNKYGELEANGVFLWRRQFMLPGKYVLYAKIGSMKSEDHYLTIKGVVLDLKDTISRSIPGDNRLIVHLYSDRTGAFDIVHAKDGDWANEINWFSMEVNQNGYGVQGTWFRPFVGDYWFDARQGSYTAMSWGGEQIVHVVP